MPELGGVRGARVSWLVSGGVVLVILLLTATAAVAVYSWPFGDSATRGRTQGWEGRPEALMKNAEEAIDRGDDASARRSLKALIRQHGRSPLASEAKRLLGEMERRELEAAVLVEEAARRRKTIATPAAGTEAAVSAKTGILGLRHAAIDKGALSWRLSVPRPSPFPAKFDRGRTYFAKIRTTRGDMTVRLFPELAPMHATSFVYLAELGFYDDLPFHRACSGFMIQGGDPSGLGTGGPAYRIPAELSTRAHVKGVLSAARASDLDSAGSQFFLMFAAAPALDRQYTVFGAVTEGIDTLDALEREAAVHDPKGVCRPRTEDRILSIRPFTR